MVLPLYAIFGEVQSWNRKYKIRCLSTQRRSMPWTLAGSNIMASVAHQGWQVNKLYGLTLATYRY